jgi:hypothetical protein
LEVAVSIHKKYIRVITIFNWDDGGGFIQELSYYDFSYEISLGEDIPIDRLQRWRLP